MILSFAFSQLWRSRHQPELQILSFALGLAIFAVTLISCLTQGLSSVLQSDASNLLGADRIIESSQPFDPSLQKWIEEFHLAQSQSVEFFSMGSRNENIQLMNVNAIAEPFPLRGKVMISTLTESSKMTNTAPLPKEIWISKGLMEKLAATLGDKLQVGNNEFTITGIIIKHPIAMSSSNVLAPLAYVNASDLSGMGVLQPGTLATYRLLLAGTTNNLNAFANNIKVKDLLPTSAKWISPQSGRRGISQTINTSHQFLAIILLLQIFLAGTAIGLCAHEYSKNQKKSIAIWRCLGASTWRIVITQVLQLFILALILMALSISLAYGVAKLGFSDIPIHWAGAQFGALTGLVLLLGFALPPIIELRKVAPSQIFQEGYGTGTGVHFISYVFAILALGFLFFVFINQPQVAKRLFALCFILGAVIFGIAWCLWSIFKPLSRLPGLVWRFGFTYLVQHRTQMIYQWLIFTFVIMLLLLVQILEQEIIPKWRTQLPEQTPNYFLLNVQNEQIGPLQEWMRKEGVPDVIFYPVVRAQMSHINGKKLRSDQGLSRPINLTWMKDLPKDNQVISGVDWEKVSPGEAVISIENGFADRQQLKLNDTISFQIGNELITAKVVQLRNVVWTSFKPNFFVIFPEKVIEQFPYSHIASIYLPKSKHGLLLALAKEYVEISIIDIDEVLQSVRNLVDKLSTALEALLLVVFVLGILIMYANLLASLKERFQESAMLQILGANKAFIAKILMVEFGVLGLFSGMIGSIMAMLLAKDLASHYFSMQFMMQPKWFWLGTLVSCALIMLLGLIGARKVFQVSPLWLLRKTT